MLRPAPASMPASKEYHTISIDDTRWRVSSGIDQCSFCRNDVVRVAVCTQAHGLCLACFDQYIQKSKTCPLCRAKIPKDILERDVEQSKNTFDRVLKGTYFLCQEPGCEWGHTYEHIKAHNQTYHSKEERVTCPHDGCEQQLPRSQMTIHRREQCSKRPHTEGYLQATYETVEQVKKLRADLIEARTSDSLSLEQKGHFFDRMATLYDLVAGVVLTGPAPKQPTEEPPGELQHGALAGASGHVVPDRSLPCRHCQVTIRSKDLVEHEDNCDQRRVKCAHCHFTLFHGYLSEHLRVCPYKPVTCSWCDRSFTRSTIREHEQRLCSERFVNCPSCCVPIKQSMLMACWCRQPITLNSPGNGSITLKRRLDANCPVYQEQGGRETTIYLAVNLAQFKGAINSRSPWKFFKSGARFSFCNIESTVVFASHPLRSVLSIRLQEHNRDRLMGRVLQPQASITPARIDLMTNQSAHTLQFYALGPFLRDDHTCFNIDLYHEGEGGQGCRSIYDLNQFLPDSGRAASQCTVLFRIQKIA